MHFAITDFQVNNKTSNFPGLASFLKWHLIIRTFLTLASSPAFTIIPIPTADSGILYILGTQTALRPTGFLGTGTTLCTDPTLPERKQITSPFCSFFAQVPWLQKSHSTTHICSLYRSLNFANFSARLQNSFLHLNSLVEYVSTGSIKLKKNPTALWKMMQTIVEVQP